jgi:hypothetical protein
MLAEQGGVCACCDKPNPEHVDHDHASGRVRGMLCFNCNQALGNVRDQVPTLERLRDYLLAAGSDEVVLPYVEYRLQGAVVELAGNFAHCGATR